MYASSALPLDVKVDYSPEGESNADQGLIIGNLNDVYNGDISGMLTDLTKYSKLINSMISSDDNYTQISNTLAMLFSNYSLYKFSGANYFLSQINTYLKYMGYGDTETAKALKENLDSSALRSAIIDLTLNGEKESIAPLLNVDAKDITALLENNNLDNRIDKLAKKIYGSNMVTYDNDSLSRSSDR